MGCGASNDTSRVQTPSLNKKPILPAIEPQPKKSSSAKSNGSSDSGIEDTEPPKLLSSPSKVPLSNGNLLVQHHQKSRLGLGETFDIVTIPKPGGLAPLRNVPRFLLVDKTPTTTVDSDLQAKIAAKQEQASRKRRELEDARRQASSRIGHRTTTTTQPPPPPTTVSLHDERHQHLSNLRDKLRQNSSNNDFNSPIHTPRTPRADSITSGMTDVANMTPRRGGFVLAPTTPSNFKPVYD